MTKGGVLLCDPLSDLLVLAVYLLDFSIALLVHCEMIALGRNLKFPCPILQNFVKQMFIFQYNLRSLLISMMLPGHILTFMQEVHIELWRCVPEGWPVHNLPNPLQVPLVFILLGDLVV